MKTFLTLLGVITVALLGVAVFLLAKGLHIDDSIVFVPKPFPERAELTIRAESGLGRPVRHERLFFGGQVIAMSTVGDDRGPLVLTCFGNASDRITSGANTARKAGDFGQVVMWDYPGYGDSSGAAGAAAIDGLADDFVALIDERAGDRPLLFWGHSLGGFVCSNLAARSRAVDGLVLETTAASIHSVARAWTPKGVPLRVTYDEALLDFDIPRSLEGFDKPVLIIGAGRDRILPVDLSRELSATLPQARYLELPEATHYSAGFDPRTQAAVAEMVAGL
ncbi:alpha/beta fold hydrolase [Algimonas porphyrae]|uniref:Alpha/beta hydrolase n=1 Tax=Algimonas porphyrae TaxID=1128113 RepID=A0ABQ5V307_9PROT|nr:alpha/beta fold hydrolase [Algimonas porphyrae]GLQ21919.1 alpha/beta hydrolase [Algimonas porphyrae]